MDRRKHGGNIVTGRRKKMDRRNQIKTEIRRVDTGHRGKIGAGQKNVGWENWHWEEKTGWWWEEEKTWDHAKEESETEEETSGRCPRDPYYNRNSRKAYVGALIGVLGDSKKGINRGPMKP